MKADEMRELAAEDLDKKLSDLKEEYFNLRFQNGTNQLENTSQVNKVRKDIARVNTIIKEKTLIKE